VAVPVVERTGSRGDSYDNAAAASLIVSGSPSGAEGGFPPERPLGARDCPAGRSGEQRPAGGRPV